MTLFKRIDIICLTVNNVEKASQWYQDIFGSTNLLKVTIIGF